MNFINRKTIASAVLCLIAVVGCTKQEEFLKRDTRSLSFPYTASTATFTIRATGDWFISDLPGSNSWTGAYDWVSVDKQSGTGDGVTYEYITVSCAQNTEAERTATIYLQGSGQTDVPILLTQANGIFEFTTFSDGSSLAISEVIKVGEESTASILIPYIKSLGNETFTVEVSSTGGAGLTGVSGSYSITSAGDGNISVPISGTCQSQGEVVFSVTATNQATNETTNLGSVQSVVRSGFDAEGNELFLVEQDFNKLPWGGDCIAGVAGVWPADRTLANITSVDVETVTCVVGENGLSNGVTSTIRSSNPALFSALGLAGWTGYTNYMRPGYLQLGTASTNTIGQPGSLVSPTFVIPSGVNHLYVTLELATWTAHHDSFEVGICNKHDGVYTQISAGNYTSRYVNGVSCRTYTDVSGIPMNTWVEYTFVLPCGNLAGQTKSVYFTIPESCWNADGTINAGRIYIDDIKVSY